MAGKDDKDFLLDESMEALARGEQALTEEEEQQFAQLAEQIEEPGLQDRILERYMHYGRDILGDQLPSHVDPRIAKHLEPHLGDVSDVRVHTGPVATAAAQAMQARAFAIGDRDIFIDKAEFNPNTMEGGALLAHEIAHTRDASTGFALSAKYGMHTSDREQFAHQVEMQFAREWEESGESVLREDDQPAAATASDGMPADPEVDKQVLLDKIIEVLEKQDRMHVERHGL